MSDIRVTEAERDAWLARISELNLSINAQTAERESLRQKIHAYQLLCRAMSESSDPASEPHDG